MQKRKWVFVFPIALVVILGSGIAVKKLARTNDVLKQHLLVKIRPIFDQGTEIRHLDLSLSSIHLRGVKLAPKGRSFLLEIEDLQIRYSIWNGIRYRFNPNKMAHEISLIHPVLTLKRHPTAKEDTLGKQNGDALKKTIEALGSIKHFTVSRADLRFENGLGQDVLLAHQLNGRLWAYPKDSADLRLTGCLFDSRKQNLHLEGKLDLLTGTLVRLTVGLDESELSQEIPLIVPGFLAIQGGRFKAFVRLDPVHGTKGFFELHNGYFSLKKAPLQFNDIYMVGSILDSNLVFHGTVQKFNGSRLTVSGRIQNWFHPQFDATLSCPQLDLNAFFAQNSIRVRPGISGNAQLNVRMSGSVENPKLDCRLYSEEFRLYGLPVRGLNSRIQISDSLLVLEGSTLAEADLGVSLSGRMDLTGGSKRSSILAELKGNFFNGLPGWLQKRVESLQGDFACRFDGELKKMVGTLRGKIMIRPKGGQTTELTPNLTYQKNRLEIDLRTDRNFRIEGEVLEPFQKDVRWSMSAHGVEWLFEFIQEGDLNRLSAGLQAQCFLNGSPKEWSFETSAVRPERKFAKTFESKLISKSQWKNRKELDFSANYFGPTGDVLPIQAHVVVTQNAVTFQQCEIGTWFYAQGQIPQRNQAALNADFRIDNFVFEKHHALFPQLSPYFGRINGRIQFSGTRATPSSRLNISLAKGRFHGMEEFEGELTCDWIGKLFHSGSVDIRKDNIPLLAGNFTPTKDDSVTGKIQSGNLRFADLTQAFTGKKNVLNGEGSFEFGIHGSGLRPVLSGRIRVQNGSVKTISFADFSADVIDTLQDQNGMTGGICTIRDGLFTRDDGLKIQFWGSIPHGKKKTGEFSVLAKGNVLGFLTESSGFFKKAAGEGEVFMKFLGGPGTWSPSSGWIKLDRGELELSAIIKKVGKLQGEARLVEGSRFLQITRFSGQVAGGLFSLTNGQIQDTPPIVFSKLGIDFGVLYLSSQGKGIPVHFPGLMESGEEGWIAFSGFTKGSPFLITGPAATPGLVGTLMLNDNRVTYPFLDTGESGPRFSFLNQVRWNLRVVPRKDVHYIRNIGSPFGNIFLDLQVQDGNGELRFQGVINDHTFDVWGNLVSTNGTIEVMDQYFKPERIAFDYPNGGNPILSGRAYTILTDSTGVRSTVWMNLVTTDRITGYEEKGGAWGKVQFRFSTDNPNMGRTEADLLAALGYSTQDIKDRAYDAVGMQVDNYFFRPLFRPLERGMRRYLGLDMVRFSSMLGRNLIQLRETPPIELDPRWFLRSSKLTVGKYLFPSLILTYSGEIQNEYGYWLHTNGIGLKHSLSLEYSIRPDLFLEMEYLYDNRLLLQRREDTRIWFRHVFPF